MSNKTNEQYLTELQEGKISILNLHHTPYSDLSVLFDTREVNESYKDEDGDWVHSTKTVVDRKALIKYEDGKYAFLVDNWFDDIDEFEMGLYAKVRLGRFYNLITPLGEYLFPNWFGEIEFHGNNLLYCYAPSKDITPNYYTIAVKDQTKQERMCSIFDKRGQVILEGVIVKSPFVNGKAIISKNGLYNYINENGQLLMEEWLYDARSFDKTENGLFAFVKTEKGWGVIDQKGAIVFTPQFSSIVKAEWANSRDYHSPLAIVGDGKGQNLLMSKYDRKGESKALILGFSDSVDSIVLVGDASRILAKRGEEWGVYEWSDDKLQYDCSIKLGELDSVEDTLWQVKGNYYRLIQKGDSYNVVGIRGLIFNEWYSEILLYGNLFKVKKKLDPSKVSAGDHGEEEASLYEFNLISSDGACKLENWTRSLTIVPFAGAFLVNVKPKVTKSYNGDVFDASFTYEEVQINQSSWTRRIKKIEGSCNIILGELLFGTWHDGIEFLSGQIFTDGYLKVWIDGKCNLVDKHGEYVSPEWVDDFVMMRWDKKSYFSTLKANTFLVKKDNKKNLVFNGKLVLNQWFWEIEHYHEPQFSEKKSKEEAYLVHDASLMGIYYLKTGLVGGRLYETIVRISEDLYFCRFDGDGHIMSLSGKIITTAPIREVQPFHNGYALVTTNQRNSYDGFKYNFINSEGKLVSPVWFDGDSYMRFDYSNDEQPLYVKVCQDSKYNLINSDKQLIFKKWYDSIEGDEGRWLICDESRGDYKYNFIDSNENLLSNEWFKGIRQLYYFDKGVYVVETERGYNVFNGDNELTLSKWSKEGIYYDDSSGLAVVVDSSSGDRHYYYLNHSGRLITPYWSYDNSVMKYYCHIGEHYEDLLIIDLHEDDFRGGYMQIICKKDGTPFFRDIIHRPSFPNSTGDGGYLSSVFGSIEECSVPGKDPVLLVDKHWPVKNGDKGQYVIMNYEGKELSEEFESIGKFDQNGYAVVKRNGLYNLINKDFRLLSCLWFTSIGYEYKSKETEYSEDMDYETGMVESTPYQVERVRRDTSFHDACLKVELAGSYNLINEAGKLQFPIWYDSLTILSYGYYKVGLNGLFNIVDASNQPASNLWFDKMGICKKDYDRIIYGGQKGDLYRLLFLRESSIIISEDWFDKVGRYDKSNGYYSVRLNGKKNFVTDDGKLLVPGWHDDQLLFRDYNGVFVVVQDNNKFNIYSSRQSKLISEDGFDKVIRSGDSLFNYGWCGVKVDEKFTFVNENGLLAEGRYDMIHDYNYGFAGIVLDGKKNYLTSEGVLLSDVWFEEISAFVSCKRAVVKINGKFNIIDSTGALLLSEGIQNVTSIGPIESDYCLLSFSSEDGIAFKKFYDFKTGHLHDSERQVKEYLERLKTDAAKEKKGATVLDADNDNVDPNPTIENRNKQLDQLIENSGKTGINYTLVSFGDKSNLVDKNGALVFEEWIDSSSIQLCQGVPLMINAENKWIIVK